MRPALDLLREIRAHGAERRAAPTLDALERAEVREARQEIAAVRFQSARYGDVWVALDPCIVSELQAEEQVRETPRPVLLAEDVARLRGKSPEAIQAVLRAAVVFPGARLIQ